MMPKLRLASVGKRGSCLICAPVPICAAFIKFPYTLEPRSRRPRAGGVYKTGTIRHGQAQRYDFGIFSSLDTLLLM